MDNSSIKSLSIVKSTQNNTPKNLLYNCNACSKQFQSVKNLNRHRKLHSNKKSYSCLQCAKSYSRSDHLSRHMISHSENKKPFKCPHCISRFTNKSHMNRHILLHNNKKNNLYKFYCYKCSDGFFYKKTYKNHLKKEHQIIEEKNCKEFRCFYPYCYSIFTNNNKLDKHISKYHNRLKQLIEYDISNNSVISKKHNLYNFKTNSPVDLSLGLGNFKESIFYNDYNKTLYMCEICLKSFDRISNLKYHEKSCKINIENDNNFTNNDLRNIDFNNNTNTFNEFSLMYDDFIDFNK